MNELHERKISELMDTLLLRLNFDVKNQPPDHLPHITEAIVLLNDFKNQSSNVDEKHIAEMKLIKNITNQIQGRENNGGNKGERKI